MTEQERLYAQYEDAFFALLMHEIAEAEGEALLEQNEQLLANPMPPCRMSSANAACARSEKAAAGIPGFKSITYEKLPEGAQRARLRGSSLWLAMSLLVFCLRGSCLPASRRPVSRPAPGR